MNKKILLILILCILLSGVSFIVYRYINPVSGKSIELSFSVTEDSGEPLSFQVFYIDGSDTQYTNYNEEQKADIILSKDNGYSALVELPYSVSDIRIDEDNKVNNVILKDMSIIYDGSEIGLASNVWNSYEEVNDAAGEDESEGYIKLNITGEDPYVIWKVSSWNIDEYVLNKVQKENRIIKIVIIVLLWIMFIVFVKHFDSLIQFPVEILYNRTLIFRLSINDFKTRFAGSYLGIIWAFVQPVVTIVLYWFVFEKAFHASGVGEVPFALWLTAGLVPWFFFSEALMGGTSALLEYQYLVKKVVFQIDILPVVKIVSALYVHIFFIVLTILIFILTGMPISLCWLQILYYSFCTFAFTLGLAYITSAITAFFRDLTQIINVLLTVGTWLTPIMWNYDSTGLSGIINVVLMANPMFYIVQGYRDSLVNHIWFWQRPALTLYFWTVTITIFCLGTVIFRRLKVHFADVL